MFYQERLKEFIESPESDYYRFYDFLEKYWRNKVVALAPCQYWFINKRLINKPIKLGERIFG